MKPIAGKNRAAMCAPALFVLVLLASVACSMGEPAPPDPSDQQADAAPAGDAAIERSFNGCASACEAQVWPRLMVGLYPDDAQADELRISIRGTRGDVKPAEPSVGQCPPGFPVASCAFIFRGRPEDTTVQLMLEDGTNPPLTFDVKLAPYNRCGREIAYVPIYRDEAGTTWTPGATRYISPCDTL